MNRAIVRLPLPAILSCLVASVAFGSRQPTIAFGSRQPTNSELSLADRFETRCGWFSNPTPANIWLYDRDGEWTIGVQGGHQVEGDWDWPAFTKRQWVLTNGNYGYGCACLRLRVDRETRKVLEIQSTRARALAICRKDKSLKKWARMLE